MSSGLLGLFELMSDFIYILKNIFFAFLRPVDLDLMKSSLSRMQSWALPDLTTCPTPTPFTCSVYTSVARVCVLSKHQGYIEPSSHCLLGWGQEYDLPLYGIFPLLPDQPVIVFESFFICLFWQFSMYDPIATILPILPSSITCPTTNWVASTSLWKTGSFSIGSPVTSNQWENSQSESQRWECDQFKNDSHRAPWICGTSELRWSSPRPSSM